MQNNEQGGASADAPCRILQTEAGPRYGVSPRTAGEIIRNAVAAGVLKKYGGKKRGMTIGRWSALDAFVESGGQVRGRKAGAK